MEGGERVEQLFLPLVARYNQPKGESTREEAQGAGGKQRFANLHLTNPNLGNYFVYQTSLIPNDELVFKEKNDPW